MLLRAALLLSFISLICGSARAESPSWLRPLPESEVCLDHQEVRRIVEASWTETPPSDVSVQILTEPKAGFLIYRGQEAKFERTFQHLPTECPARQEAFAVAIVIAIEHLLQEDGNDVDPSLAPSVAPTAEPGDGEARSVIEPQPEKAVIESGSSPSVPRAKDSPHERPSEGTASDERDAPVRVRIALSTGPLFQVLPKTALSSQLRAELLFGSFSAGVEVLRGFPVNSTLDEGTVRSNLWGLGVSTCLESGSLLLGAGLCLLGLAGRMEAQASGLPGSGSTAASYWASGGVGGTLRFPARRKWGVEIAGNIVANLLRPGVAVDVGGGPDREDNAPVVGYRTSFGGFFVLP